MDILIKRCLKFAKPLSALLYIVGVVGLLLLSQPDFNYETYVSENALLIGLVDETYKPDPSIATLAKVLDESANDKLKTFSIIRREMKSLGLEVYEQKFTFSHKLLQTVGNVSSSNLYAILRSRSGSRTEALVVIAPLRASGESEAVVTGSYIYLISLAKVLSTQLYWSKDIIFLFPDMEYVGLIAWLDAYHGVSTSKIVQGAKLKGRSGSLQAGISLEFPSLNMARMDVSYQGLNGELPNLDVVNTIARLARKHTIPLTLHGQLQGFAQPAPLSALHQLFSSIWVEASGSPSGLHGPLINFQVPCLTLRGIPTANQQLNSNYIRQVGSLIEGFLRCLNNLQERMHQSFYYYLLPDLWHYISIGVYTPFFYAALAGLLLQVLRIYTELSSKSSSSTTSSPDNKKNDDTPSKSTSSSKNPSASLESDTEVRQRHTSPTSDTTKPLIDTKEGQEGDQAPVFNPFIPGLFPAVASFALSLAGGVAVWSFPDWLYTKMLAKAADNPDGVWQLTEQAFAVIFGSAVLGLAVVLPVLALLTRWKWFGYGQDWRLSCAIGGLLWSGFLGCLSPLNISTAFLLLLVVEPVLLLIISHRKPGRLHRCVLSLLLLLISPPVLVTVATLIHPHVPQYPPARSNPIRSFDELSPTLLVDLVGKTLFQAHMEAAVLGSWSWSLLALGVTPLWLFSWSGLILAGEAV